MEEEKDGSLNPGLLLILIETLEECFFMLHITEERFLVDLLRQVNEPTDEDNRRSSACTWRMAASLCNHCH